MPQVHATLEDDKQKKSQFFSLLLKYTIDNLDIEICKRNVQVYG